MKWRSFRLSVLWCWHQLLTLGLAVLVLVAVFVGVGRQLLPAVDQYQHEVELTLSEKMGMPVRLQALHGEWEGLGPHFSLLGMELRDPQKPQQVLLRIPEIEIRPSLWQSLRHWETRLDVRVRGLDIHLDQQPDGRMQLRELASVRSSDPKAAIKAVRFILRQPALSLQESRVALDLKDYPAVVLSHIDLLSRNDGDEHRLAGSVRVPASTQSVGMQLLLQGDPLDWQRAALSVWLHLPVLTLDQWLPAEDIAGVRLARLEGGGDYWFHFSQGHLHAAQAVLDWRDVMFESVQGRHHVQAMRGQMAWSQNKDGWQISADKLQGRVDALPWPSPSLALHSSAKGLTLAAARVNIADLTKLLMSMPVSATASTWLRDVSPSGELTGLRIDLQKDDAGTWQPLRVDAQASQIKLNATAELPGVQGVAGWLRWTPQAGWLGLDSRVAQLDLRQIFREPMLISRLQGNLKWTMDADTLRLSSDRLQLSNPDAHGEAVLSLTVPRADPHAAHLSLLAGIQDARAVSTWRYVPWPSAGDKTLDWLRRSILAGQVTQGDFLYEGPLHSTTSTTSIASAPTPTSLRVAKNRQAKGNKRGVSKVTPAVLEPHRMLMRFALKAVRLDYEKDWPELRDLDAIVTLDGNHLDVEGRSASLLDASQGRALTAVIADLAHPLLSVRADVSSNGADLMRLFRESPLRHVLTGLDEVLALDGPVNGALNLAIPLQQGLPEIEVTAHLKDNRLRLKPVDLPATELTGELTYRSKTGLLAPQLKARLLEVPVTASISSKMQHGELAEVDVTLDGSAGVPALRHWLGFDILDVATGSTPYQARIAIASGTAPVSLLLTSPLTGVQIALPAPFGKKAAEALPLRYQGSFGVGEQLARLQYGSRFNAGLVWQGARLDRALLRLQGTAVAWPQHSGVEIEGSLPRFEWREWAPLLERMQKPVATTVKSRAAPMPVLTRLDLKVHELLAQGLRLQNAVVALQRQPTAWKLEMSSDELAGNLLLPNAAGSEIHLGFSRLQWPLPSQPLTVVAKPAAMPVAKPLASTDVVVRPGINPVVNAGNAGANPNPLAVLAGRPVRIDGDGLRMSTWPGLGVIKVSAHLLPSPYGLGIEELALSSAVLGFKGRMDWQWRGGTSTRLRGDAISSNVAGLLSAFAYAPSLVSPKASAEFDLSWPGAPDALMLSALDGHLALHVEQGRLLNVSNAASASRVFGWFDLDNLRRRFSGDFGDVLRKGLYFDKASLSGPIQAGVMQPSVLSVDGPSLSAQGRGRLDLARQQVDQDLTVQLPVSSAVPLAAVVVAGPLIGGAVAAAQMVFQKQINKVTRMHYHVSGDWADPRIERGEVVVLEVKTPPPAAPVAGSAAVGSSTPGSDATATTASANSPAPAHQALPVSSKKTGSNASNKSAPKATSKSL